MLVRERGRRQSGVRDDVFLFVVVDRGHALYTSLVYFRRRCRIKISQALIDKFNLHEFAELRRQRRIEVCREKALYRGQLDSGPLLFSLAWSSRA